MAQTLDDVRRSISAIIAEIQVAHRALGLPPDAADREVYDIICRIERRVLANMPNRPAQKAAAE